MLLSLFKKLIFLFTVSNNVYANTIIFYMKKNDSNHCDLILHNLDKNKIKKIIGDLKTCPKEVKWDRINKKTYLNMNDTFYEYSKNNRGSLFEYPPFKKKDHKIKSYWISPSSHKLRVAILKIVDQKKLFQKDWSGYILINDKKLYFEELPPWGLPGLSQIYEYQEKKWKLLSSVPTKTSAGETPGFNNNSHFYDKPKNLISLKELRKVDYSNINFDKKKIQNLNVSLNKSYDWGRIQLKDKDAVIVNSIFGDTVHLIPPVYFYLNKGESLKRIDLELEQQMYLSINNKWLLLDYEYPKVDLDFDSNVFVYKFPSEKLKFKLNRSGFAAFFPFVDLWNQIDS